MVGLGINTLVLGLTSYLISFADFSTPGGPAEHSGAAGHPGDRAALFVQRWPLYLLVVVIPLTWWLVDRSRWGLELRAVGENPQAADVTGIKVNLRRRQALLWCGLCRAGRGVPGGRRGRLVQREHDRRPRVHRHRRGDLRGLAAATAPCSAACCSASPTHCGWRCPRWASSSTRSCWSRRRTCSRWWRWW